MLNDVQKTIGMEISKPLVEKFKEIVNQQPNKAKELCSYYHLGLRYGREGVSWQEAISKYDLSEEKVANFLQGYTTGESSKNNFNLLKDLAKYFGLGVGIGTGIYTTAKIVTWIFVRPVKG